MARWRKEEHAGISFPARNPIESDCKKLGVKKSEPFGFCLPPFNPNLTRALEAQAEDSVGQLDLLKYLDH
jgi:hypothetical protein